MSYYDAPYGDDQVFVNTNPILDKDFINNNLKNKMDRLSYQDKKHYKGDESYMSPSHQLSPPQEIIYRHDEYCMCHGCIKKAIVELQSRNNFLVIILFMVFVYMFMQQPKPIYMPMNIPATPNS